jgi:hypothetical protein
VYTPSGDCTMACTVTSVIVVGTCVKYYDVYS